MSFDPIGAVLPGTDTSSFIDATFRVRDNKLYVVLKDGTELDPMTCPPGKDGRGIIRVYIENRIVEEITRYILHVVYTDGADVEVGEVGSDSGKVTPSIDPNNAFKIGSDDKPFVEDLQPQINELKSNKFPNVTKIGEPTYSNGTVSGFSEDNYLQFPMIVDFRRRPFVINFEITTGSNVTNQQNIFDSDYGFAFAVRNSKFVIAMSSDGVTWDLGESIGSHTITPRTTYKIRISWNGSLYKVEYSIDGGESYITDITKSSSLSLYPKQIYIGVGMNFGSVLNSFTGSINFNDANLTIANELVWIGMDDIGLATRLATDLSNLDAAGEKRIKEIAKFDVATLTDKDIALLKERLGLNGSFIPSPSPSEPSEEIPAQPQTVLLTFSTATNGNTESLETYDTEGQEIKTDENLYIHFRGDQEPDLYIDGDDLKTNSDINLTIDGDGIGWLETED